jgi:hypothetical protein
MTEASDGSRSTSTEQARLEATAIVASRVSREEAGIRVRHERVRSLWRDVMILALVAAVAILGVRTATESSRTKKAVQQSDQRNCNLYRDVAIIPLAPKTTPTGLHLIADFRNSYYIYHCQDRHGSLPPADPRLRPYLVPAAK